MTIRSKTNDVAFAAADEEIIAAIGLDPDARLLTREDFRRMRHTPRVKLIRRALRPDREGFATRYGIPLDVIEDWESRKKVPDEVARSYLRAIAADPDGVAAALADRKAS